ncbi:hypothetical protein Gotur_035766 [Gossypium turneri]
MDSGVEGRLQNNSGPIELSSSGAKITEEDMEVVMIRECQNYLSNVISALVAEKLVRKACETFLAYAKELDWKKRLNVVKGLANTLYYMHHGHSQHIVHRDISSNNVLLDLDYEARVSDFGSARILKPNLVKILIEKMRENKMLQVCHSCCYSLIVM